MVRSLCGGPPTGAFPLFLCNDGAAPAGEACPAVTAGQAKRMDTSLVDQISPAPGTNTNAQKQAYGLLGPAMVAYLTGDGTLWNQVTGSQTRFRQPTA